MMQSILLPAASSQLKEGPLSSNSANVEESDLLNAEGQDKKNSADFSTLLDALLPGEELQEQQIAEDIKVEEENEVGLLLAESLAENSDADENDVMLNGNESEQALIEDDASQQQDGDTKLTGIELENTAVSSQVVDNKPELTKEADAPLIAEDLSKSSQVDKKQDNLNLSDSENVEIAAKAINNLDETSENEAVLDSHITTNSITKLSGDALDDKLQVTDNINQAEKIDTNKTASVINLNPEKTKQATDILADIENAQKVNTQVNQAEKNSATNVDKALLFTDSEGEKVNKKEGGISSELDKVILKESINVKEKSALDENGKLEQTAKIPEKAEQFLSPKLMDRAPIPTLTETQQVRAFTSATSDLNKTMAQAQSMNSTTNSSTPTPLSDALALQSKQSAALLGERVLMMLANDKKEIQVRLDPAELGSMNIKLQMQQDQVQLTIQAQAGQTRDLLEQNLPRLREQLAQQGVNLGEANIEQQNQGQQQKHNRNDVIQQGKEGSSEQLSVSETESEAWLAREVSYTPQGIDFYA